MREHLVLTVTDTGVGIAPEEQELVFEKFRQAGNTADPRTRRHRPGLVDCARTVEVARRRVSLQSELGRGSTFTVKVAAHLKADPNRAFDLIDETRSV